MPASKDDLLRVLSAAGVENAAQIVEIIFGAGFILLDRRYEPAPAPDAAEIARHREMTERMAEGMDGPWPRK